MDGDLKVLTTVVGHLAATSSIAGVGVLANHAGAVGGAADVDGIVTATGTASVSARGGADEGAGVLGAVPATGALGTLGGEFHTLHVDLTRDIEAAVGAGTEGELEDGLVEETHEQVRVVESGAAAAGETIGSGKFLALAGTKLDGDEGLVGVDPHGRLAPAVQHGVLAGGVCEGGRVGTAIAKPDLTVLLLVVETDLGAEGGCKSRDAFKDAGSDASKTAVGGRVGRVGGGGGALGRRFGGGGGRSRSSLVSRGGRLGRRSSNGGGSSDDLGLGGGGGRGSGGRGAGRSVAVVDLAPVYAAEVVGDVGPVNVLGVALHVAARDVNMTGSSQREQAGALTVACGSWRGGGQRRRRCRRRGCPAPEQIGNAYRGVGCRRR